MNNNCCPYIIEHAIRLDLSILKYGTSPNPGNLRCPCVDAITSDPIPDAFSSALSKYNNSNDDRIISKRNTTIFPISNDNTITSSFNRLPSFDFGVYVHISLTLPKI